RFRLGARESFCGRQKERTQPVTLVPAIRGDEQIGFYFVVKPSPYQRFHQGLSSWRRFDIEQVITQEGDRLVIHVDAVFAEHAPRAQARQLAELIEQKSKRIWAGRHCRISCQCGLKVCSKLFWIREPRQAWRKIRAPTIPPWRTGCAV